MLLASSGGTVGGSLRDNGSIPGIPSKFSASNNLESRGDPGISTEAQVRYFGSDSVWLFTWGSVWSFGVMGYSVDEASIYGGLFVVLFISEDASEDVFSVPLVYSFLANFCLNFNGYGYLLFVAD
jgi:hypothetical protein